MPTLSCKNYRQNNEQVPAIKLQASTLSIACLPRHIGQPLVPIFNIYFLMLVVFATKNIELQTLDEQQGSAVHWVGGTIEYCSGKTYNLVEISLSEKQYFVLKLIRVLFPVLSP